MDVLIVPYWVSGTIKWNSKLPICCLMCQAECFQAILVAGCASHPGCSGERQSYGKFAAFTYLAGYLD